MKSISDEKGIQPIKVETRQTKHKSNFTEYKIRKAHDIASKKGITKVGYLIGILKRLS